ncbi:A24 family peptidase [Paraburkholderia pallida]|uniref:Peptidase A24 n=1 Tax=Paraburkholderia pallida TaxID=2547399 RepID=A0A4P7CR47_9BURK|nr:prepilin peptidase [Paraburkholderia pallida]QBQ98315.1 peptidase A24 [Paraburkholderia pallida]
MFAAHLPPQPIPLCVIAWLLVAASTDIVSRRIPNWLVGSGLAVSFGVQIFLQGALAGAAAWFTGAATGFAMLLPFYLLRGMAAGDVKLMTMVGAWVGASIAFDITLATFLIGGLWSALVVIGRGRVGRLLRNLGFIAVSMSASWRTRGDVTLAHATAVRSVGSIPYGVAIAAGTLGVLFTMAA